MPLPENVVAQLGKDPIRTQGWAFGAILFSAGVLFLAVLVYAGLVFGYEPFLQSQVTQTQNQLTALNNSISTADQTQLVDFYSETANLQTLLQKHVLVSQFFTWLENNTEANAYFQTFALGTGDRVTLAGDASSEADINQQVAIFENSPEVSSVSVSNVTTPIIPAGPWGFNITLIMTPSVFMTSTQ